MKNKILHGRKLKMTSFKFSRTTLLVFLICISILLIFATTILLKTSISELFRRCAFTAYVLMQKPQMPPPSDIFRQHIIDPVPESVKNIKADRPKDVWGYTYTLRFNISRSDLDLIINSRPFKRVFNPNYLNGNLSWYWDTTHGITIPVYADRVWQHEPAWFKLGACRDNPNAYAFEKEGERVNIQFLLYNENVGQAYFIVYSPTH